MPSAASSDPYVERLVTLLLAACEDARMNDTLDMLLSQPDDRRRFVVQQLLQRFQKTGAPRALSDAFLPLLDDAVAEKAYEVIYQCRRGAAKP